MKKIYARLTPALALAMVFGFSKVAAAADDATTQPSGTASVVAHVVDADGKAVADATVTVSLAMAPKPVAAEPAAASDNPDSKPKHKGKAKALATGKTADDGSVTLANLPAGDVVVAANLKGTGKGMEKVTLVDGQAATVNITLKGKPKAQ